MWNNVKRQQIHTTSGIHGVKGEKKTKAVRMKFRQRLAWIVVVIYLGASFAVIYYIFEISEHYNRFALEHSNLYHQNGQNLKRPSLIGSFLHHVTDIPLQVWLIFLLPPYLQAFGMVLAWTRADPKLSLAYMWPGLVYVKLKNIWRRLGGSVGKPMNSTVVSNGNIIIDT